MPGKKFNFENKICTSLSGMFGHLIGREWQKEKQEIPVLSVDIGSPDFVYYDVKDSAFP